MAKGKDAPPPGYVAAEIEMTNVELNKRVNELIDVCNEGQWTPLEFLMVLKGATDHVQKEHKIMIYGLKNDEELN